MKRALFIFAGNLNEFKQYCDDHDISRSAARYIHGPEEIRGLDMDKVQIVFCGQYYTRPDYKEVSQMVDLYKGRANKKEIS